MTSNPAKPSPVARLGMTLFLASEAMFLLGVVSAYFVLRAGHRNLFAGSAAVLSKTIIALQIALLVGASVALSKWKSPQEGSEGTPDGSGRTAIEPGLRAYPQTRLGSGWAWVVVGLLMACGLSQLAESIRLTSFRGTAVVRDNGELYVYDGRLSPAGLASVAVRGRKAVAPDGFDVRESTPATIESLRPVDADAVLPVDSIRVQSHYGPSRNNFFGCYFLLTIAHAVHVAAGVLACIWFIYKPSPTGTIMTRSYLHFFNGVGIMLLMLLALG